MNLIRKAFTAIRLHWRTLRLQLALLYAGAFVVLGAALLAVSGLLVRSGSVSVTGEQHLAECVYRPPLQRRPRARFPGRGSGRGRARLADRRPVPAAAAHDHRNRAGHLGQQPEPSPQHHRPRG